MVKSPAFVACDILDCLPHIFDVVGAQNINSIYADILARFYDKGNVKIKKTK